MSSVFRDQVRTPGRWVGVRVGAVVALVAIAVAATRRQPTLAPIGCDPDNAGLKLPPGFCAGVFFDSIKGARHMAVAANGDVFVSVWQQGGGRHPDNGVAVLRDSKHTGHADVRQSFAGPFPSSEVAFFDGYLYAEFGTGVLRYPMKAGNLAPSGPPDTIVSGLPGGGNHPLKTFAIAKDGSMYVNVGSSTNVCPPMSAVPTPGADPCPEVDRRAGIWLFDARKLHQTQQTGEHFARGVRNSVAITTNPADGTLWTAQHGRDDLKTYSQYFTNEQSADLPAELLLHIKRGDDYGWPYCYFDQNQMKTMLAPEYGGDGKEQGRCAKISMPVSAFPGHWAPDGILLYSGSMLPAKYRQGAFIAFHGSWDRSPLPQAGYNITFQPTKDGKPSGPYEIFADGFAPHLNERGAVTTTHRPVGITQGPDGALYVSDDALGRIYKIQYSGPK